MYLLLLCVVLSALRALHIHHWTMQCSNPNDGFYNGMHSGSVCMPNTDVAPGTRPIGGFSRSMHFLFRCARCNHLYISIRRRSAGRSLNDLWKPLNDLTNRNGNRDELHNWIFSHHQSSGWKSHKWPNIIAARILRCGLPLATFAFSSRTKTVFRFTRRPTFASLYQKQWISSQFQFRAWCLTLLRWCDDDVSSMWAYQFR